MMSATLVPQIEDLLRRFAPRGITIDLNEDMKAAESGTLLYSFSLCQSLIFHIHSIRFHKS
jgi:hypothetical protein